MQEQNKPDHTHVRYLSHTIKFKADSSGSLSRNESGQSGLYRKRLRIYFTEAEVFVSLLISAAAFASAALTLILPLLLLFAEDPEVLIAPFEELFTFAPAFTLPLISFAVVSVC